MNEPEAKHCQFPFSSASPQPPPSLSRRGMAPPHYEPKGDDEDHYEERRGLLTGEEDKEYKEDVPAEWSSKKVFGVAIAFILLLVGAVVAKTKLATLFRPPKAYHDEIRSNGTHDFRKTVLIVSIDGLRADYLDRGLTPHLLDISKKGLRAKSMKPIFPTLTFPNHWALLTGLHAESHGIVGNNFWDPKTDSEFHYNQEASAWNPDWWLGEPMWETAGKAGVITANLMWPGPPKTSSGAEPTYFVPWRDRVPLDEKLDQIMTWIDLPFEERPQLIMGYEPSLDQAGHATGPMSARVNATLLEVDKFAKNLHTALVERNLDDIVDIVFVSDHGMTDTSHPEMIYMDDIIGTDGLESIAHEDGWPSMGLRFASEANQTHYLNLLLEASDARPEAFDVYTHETMPERYHFVNNERIAPIYVVPKIGYALTTKKEGNVGMTKGNHGYDNDELSMHAMFVAHGPFTAVVKTLHQGRSLSARVSKDEGWHSTSDDAYVMKRFANVEIYNLVMRLLGIEHVAAKTNGTVGFWDQYF